MAILTNMVNSAKMTNLANYGQSFDLQTNSLNQFSKEKYGDQSKGLLLSCMG